jgi:hypothetical protein
MHCVSLIFNHFLPSFLVFTLPFFLFVRFPTPLAT